MGTFVEDFLLAPGKSIQDAVDGIERWRAVSENGRQYNLNIQQTYLELRRSWYPSGSYCMLCFAPLLFGIICFLMSKQHFKITLSFSDGGMGDAVGVHAVLDGKVDEKRDDYYELKTYV